MRPKTVIEVRDNPAQSRFEAIVDGQLSIASYAVRGATIIFDHTVVPEALRGRGIAGQLIAAALAAARARGLAVVPACSFVADHMRRDPETHDQLAPAGRAMLGL